MTIPAQPHIVDHRWSPAVASRQARLEQAMEQVVKALDADQPIDRLSLLAEYADVATELAACLDNLDFIQSVAPQLTQESLGAGDVNSVGRSRLTQPSPVSLGDFRIIREIGRGGMGVVYEAEQLSLGRRIALKVLPFASMLDKQQLARFKNEARAAATLDHPNIVAVHSVGVDRGVHYYAMHLVEGESLAEVIARLRAERGAQNSSPAQSRAEGGPNDCDVHPHLAADATITHHPAHPNPQTGIPTVPVAVLSTLPESGSREWFHTVANLGIQAAEALDHAHQNGVLHRDVKPGNLLLDDAGKLWVTDFGLARLEADAGMTMTGDLIGTLRYMSPEQALAKRVVVDHRSDVYSLGVTLYELLTLHPAYSAEDRQELLRQIAFEEPRQPRQFDATIPRDLETIVLKSIEKNPVDRYASAQEFADDLCRFTGHRPVAARRPHLWSMLRKWSSRHVGAVLTAIVGLFLLTALFAGSTIVVADAWKRAQLSEAALQVEVAAERRNLYRANIHIAQQAWEDGRVGAATQLLNEFLPKPGQADLRGWEWYYLKSLCNTEVQNDSGMLIPGAGAGSSQLVATRNGDLIVVQELGSAEVLLSMTAICIDRSIPAGHGDYFASSRDCQLLLHAGVTRWPNKSFVEAWDLQTRTRRFRIDLDALVEGCAWSPDGQRIAIITSRRHVTLLDARDGRLTLTLDRLQWTDDDPVRSLAWSADGTLIAIGGNHGEVAMCSPTTGKLVRQFDAHSAMVSQLAFSPNAEHLASVSLDQRVGICSTNTGKMEHRLVAHNGPPNAVSWSSDGKFLATGGDDGVVKVWDALTWQCVNTFIGHQDAIFNVAWLDQNEMLASSSRDGTRTWRVHENPRFVETSLKPAHAWAPGGQQLFAWANKTTGIELASLDLRTKRLDSFRNGDAERPTASRAGTCVHAMDVDATGKHLAVAIDAGVIEIWNLTTRTLKRSIKANSIDLRSVAWSPDGTRLVSGGLGDNFSVWNSSNGDKVTTLDSRHSPMTGSAAWSPDGSQLATLSWWGDVSLWDARHWQRTVRLSHEVGNEWCVDGQRGLAWSPTGDRLAARLSGWLSVWDARTGKQLFTIRTHVADTTCVAWSPDGSRIATGSADHTVGIWDAGTGDEMLILKTGDGQGTESLSWSPDGKILAAGTDSLKLWDASPAYLTSR